MTDITFYSVEGCPWCKAARTLLDSRGFDYEEIDIDTLADAETHLMERTGRTSLPQILLGERAIGGFQELKALLASGDPDLLAA